MRVLLVAYHFPPDPQVGALRPASLAEALRDWGHDVDVITARLPGEGADERAAMAGVRVHTVTLMPTARDVYAKAKHWWRSRRAGAPASPDSPGKTGKQPLESVPGWKPPVGHVPGWKRYLGSLMWLPDDRQGFILPAVRRARTLRGRVDLVYTTAPPYSTHLVGLLLKRRLHARWAVEFRDPWTENPWKPAFVRSRVSDAIDRWLERRCLTAADHIVCLTEGIRRGFAATPGVAFAPARAIVVRNGIPPASVRPPRQGTPGQPFRIVYVGTLYHKRDPRTFLRALRATATRLALDPSRLRADLVGDCRQYRGEAVDAMVHELRLDEFVHIRDWVPHDEAAQLVGGADLLLLLAQNQPVQVPQKLYEYLGTRVPILAFADPDGETADMLRRVGGHYLVADADDAAAEAALTDAIRAQPRPAATPPSEAVLEELSTRSQLLRLKSALGA